MQDQYAGDVGDYVKFALLKALGVDKKIGIGWYLTPNERHKNDGRHIEYLSKERAAAWRHFDPDIYDKLRRIIASGRRTVNALEEAMFGENVKYYNARLSDPKDRQTWFQNLKNALNETELLFVDPDNGIEPNRFDENSKKSIKSATFAEIRALCQTSRPLVIYHHHTRFRGGHDAEIAHLGQKLAKMDIGCVCAVRAKMWSPRVFFIVGGLSDTWVAAEHFAERWTPHVQFYPIKGPPDSLGLSPDNPYSDWAEARIEKAAERMRAGEFDHLMPRSPLKRD